MIKIGVRQRIISELLKCGGLSVTKLAERIGASRVSVSKELQVLTDKAIISKSTQAHGYALSSKIAFVIFKFYREYAELVSFSLDGEVYSREKLDLLYSLSHDDNVLFLSPRVQRQAQSLKDLFDKVFMCIVHNEKLSRATLASRLFERSELRSELIARQILYHSSDETVLYVNTEDTISFLCKDGKAITPISYPDGKVIQHSQSALSLIKPSRIVLEGKDCEPLALTCAKLNIPLTVIVNDGKLFSDELGIIEETLHLISK